MADQVSRSIEQQREPGSKRGMEVIAGPWDVIVTVIDIWVGVMPRPEQLLYADDVKRNVKQHNRKADCTQSKSTFNSIVYTRPKYLLNVLVPALVHWA